MTEPRIKVRDLPPTAIRLTPDLRHALAREAAINGRTLHGEIIHRLKTSVSPEGAPAAGSAHASEPAGAYTERSDSERALLTQFRRLSPEKQLALLSLLK